MGEAREEFAAELRHRRAAAGLSLADVAAATHCHRAFLHRVETGQRWPSRAVAAQLDVALAARRRLLAAWVRGQVEHREESEHRRLLAASLRSCEQLDALLAPPAGQAADDALARVDELSRAYLTTPPAPMLRDALAARDATAQRLAGLHRAEPRRELTRAAGYLSGVLAYAALDLGNPGAAAAHAATAYRAGTATGDGALLAWTRATQSLIARFRQDYAAARDGYAHADGGTAGPRLLAGEAQSLANLGDRAGTHRALTAAEAARERAGRDDFGGLFAFSPAKLSYYGGSDRLHPADHLLLHGQWSRPNLPQVLQQRPQRPDRPRVPVPGRSTIQDEPIHDLPAQRGAVQPAFAQPAAEVGHQPQVHDPRLRGVTQQPQPGAEPLRERRQRALDLDQREISHAFPSP